MCVHLCVCVCVCGGVCVCGACGVMLLSKNYNCVSELHLAKWISFNEMCFVNVPCLRSSLRATYVSDLDTVGHQETRS